jgi:hypothetical protein
MTSAVSWSRPARNLMFVRDRYRKRHEVYGACESRATICAFAAGAGTARTPVLAGYPSCRSSLPQSLPFMTRITALMIEFGHYHLFRLFGPLP